jgi:hypothetical protein
MNNDKIQLRFVNRFQNINKDVGYFIRVLQYREVLEIQTDGYGKETIMWSSWSDVPIVDEERE